MKKHTLMIAIGIAVLLLGLYAFRFAQTTYDYQLVTTIESVVPGGLGRSRMITSTVDGAMEEKEMKNFFSLTGINFKNVKENDKMITDKVTEMTTNGWELVNVTSGVYSPGVGSDAASAGAGIFITRYLFKKQKG
ncbi:MAG: hypothetical protein ACK4TA_22110 [Saprospiraceae bacterium]